MEEKQDAANRGVTRNSGNMRHANEEEAKDESEIINRKDKDQEERKRTEEWV
jgi:hypothetical protein